MGSSMKLQENYWVPSSQVIPFTSAKLVIRLSLLRAVLTALPRLSLLRAVLTVFCSIAHHRRLGASMGMPFYESMTVSRWLVIFWVSLNCISLPAAPLLHSTQASRSITVSFFVAVGCWSILAYTRGTYIRTESKTKVQWMSKQFSEFYVMCSDIGPGRSSAHGDLVDCRPPCGIAGCSEVLWWSS